MEDTKIRTIVIQYKNILPWLVELPESSVTAHALVPLFEDVYILLEIRRIGTTQWNREITIKYLMPTNKKLSKKWMMAGQISKMYYENNTPPWSAWIELVVDTNPYGYCVQDICIFFDIEAQIDKIEIPENLL